MNKFEKSWCLFIYTIGLFLIVFDILVYRGYLDEFWKRHYERKYFETGE